jgi:hypothetical protein
MIFRKEWFKNLEQHYKLFWFYLLADCDHAGIWETDFEVASIRIGTTIDSSVAERLFSGQIQVLDAGKRWFIKDFPSFQYGHLNEKNPIHRSVKALLGSKGLQSVAEGLTQGPLQGPLQGPKDKDKDKDKDKVKDKEQENSAKYKDRDFQLFWIAYPKKVGKGAAAKAFFSCKTDVQIMLRAIAWQEKTDQWAKERGQFIPNPATWLHQQRWLDEKPGPSKPLEPSAPYHKPYVIEEIPPDQEAKGSLLEGMRAQLKQREMK